MVCGEMQMVLKWLCWSFMLWQHELLGFGGSPWRTIPKLVPPVLIAGFWPGMSAASGAQAGPCSCSFGWKYRYLVTGGT